MTSRHLPEAEEALPISIGPKTPSPTQTFAEPKRSITPRGPLFPSLGEAHRNITSRLAIDLPIRKPSGDSLPQSDVFLQERSSPIDEDPADNIGATGAFQRHASDLVGSLASHSMAGRSLTDRSSIAKLCKSATVTNAKLRALAAGQDRHDVTSDMPQYSDFTASTVGRIVDRYAAAGSDQSPSPPESPDLSYTFEPPPRRRGATAFHEEADQHAVSVLGVDSHERNVQSLRRQVIDDASGAMGRANSITHLPSNISEHDWIRGNGFAKRHPNTHVQPCLEPRAPDSSPLRGSNVDWTTEPESFGTSENFLESTRSLVPSPLRIPSRGDIKPSQDVQAAPVSIDADISQGSGLEETSSDSIDDPFKYDNSHYKRIRQLGKEREISRALKQLQEVETRPGSITIAVSPETSPQRADKSDGRGDERLSDVEGHRRSRFRANGSFFDADAFRALTGDTPHNHGANVKVVIHKSSDSGVLKGNNDNRSVFGLSFERIDRRSERSLCGRPNDGDWITEATSEADLGIPSNSELGNGIKTTGSSIADYSEDGFITSFPRFGSRDRILQRPTDPYADPNSYELHDMRGKNTGGATSRSIGFAANNLHPNPNLSRVMRSQNGALNPFRRDYTRADANSYFNCTADQHARSRYEFRDSTSTCAQGFDSNQAIMGTHGTFPSASMPSIPDVDLRHRERNSFAISQENASLQNNQESHAQSHHSDQHFHQLNCSTRANGQDQAVLSTVAPYKKGSVSMTSTSSKFSFRLLRLSEAQELQKVRRASEATSCMASSLGYHRSFSDSSARVNLTPLPRPAAAYMRGNSHVRKGSRLSLTFTPPLWGSSETNNTPGPTDCTPLDASASRLLPQPKQREMGTPTATRDWYTQERERLRAEPSILRLPTDRRVRPRTSNRTLQGIMDHDPASVWAAEEHYISHKARSRRRLFFYAMLTLSILPFFALLALNGSFDNSLSWFTHGEVYRLSKKQRKVIKTVFIVECIMYAALVAAITAYFVTVSQVHH